MNDTTWTYASGGVRVQLPDSSYAAGDHLRRRQDLRQQFPGDPRCDAARASIGRLSLNQTVPTDAVRRHGAVVARVSAGSRADARARDFRWVDGDSIEDAFDAVTGSTKTLHRVAGGTQRSLGVFVQDVFAPAANLTVTASARLDRWRNYDAHNTETILATGAVSDPVLPDKSDSVVSPRVGALYRVHERRLGLGRHRRRVSARRRSTSCTGASRSARW